MGIERFDSKKVERGGSNMLNDDAYEEFWADLQQFQESLGLELDLSEICWRLNIAIDWSFEFVVTIILTAGNWRAHSNLKIIQFSTFYQSTRQMQIKPWTKLNVHTSERIVNLTVVVDTR